MRLPVIPRVPFVQRHFDSECSILDGACRIPPLAERAAELEMPEVALPDHGSLAGAVELHREARKQGIKPVVGCELYVTDSRRRQEKGYAHLTVLAESNEGYSNLIKLSSLGYLEGYYYKPRVDWELLDRHSTGLVALSGCLSGRVCKALEEGRADDASGELDRLTTIFGNDSVYVEMQNAHLDVQARINPLLAELAQKRSLPLVATGDVHYLRHEDARAHEALLCIQSGDSLKNPNHWKFETDHFYFKTPEEMAADFPGQEAALRTTLEVAERCHVEIELDRMLLPHFPTPDGRDAFEYLVELCERGVEKRYGTVTPDIRDRLKFELKTIKEIGFSDYFLIVADFVGFAKRNGISVGPGRGSAAGSLVAYCLEITDLDPTRYDLRFERFLNPGRKSMPDMDIDFAVAGRDRVINYVREKYGRDRVAQIITFGTMAARAAVRDAGRVLEHPYGVVDRIAKLIPEGPGQTLAECLKPGAELKQAYDSDPAAKEIVDLAQPLEGLTRQDGIHAAAVVARYRPGPMAYIPVYARRKNGQEPVTYADERLKALTTSTYGICIYQEQYMEIAKQIAGFTPAEADDLRKAIGKKIHSLMASLKEKFLEGCATTGTTPAVAQQLWKDMEASQDYSFNKAHAACYAMIAYRTAYMKAHHPREYMAALISSVMNTKDRVPFYVNACDEMGIEVLPLDVNESQIDFAVVEGKIRFGLSAVKNVGEPAARAIIGARDGGGPFASIWDFCERVDPQASN